MFGMLMDAVRKNGYSLLRTIDVIVYAVALGGYSDGAESARKDVGGRHVDATRAQTAVANSL